MLETIKKICSWWCMKIALNFMSYWMHCTFKIWISLAVQRIKMSKNTGDYVEMETEKTCTEPLLLKGLFSKVYTCVGHGKQHFTWTDQQTMLKVREQKLHTKWLEKAAGRKRSAETPAELAPKWVRWPDIICVTNGCSKETHQRCRHCKRDCEISN